MKNPVKAVGLAYALAAYAHDGQTDKAGQPYINHPVAVSGLVWSDEMKVVALLHDVLEDTFVTPETIENLFGAEILAAVQALTRQKGESYMDFIKRAKQNPLARVVKIADLEHNMDLSRIPNPTDEDRKRCDKYRKAKSYLIDN